MSPDKPRGTSKPAGGKSSPRSATGNAHDDPRAMKLAETTDVSPNQAKDLLRKHGEAGAKRRAKEFKAEG